MISSFSEYQKEAMKTAVYPNIGSNLAYPVLGLINEIGELFLADGDDIDDWVHECGDVQWYCAACYQESGVEFDLFNSTLSPKYVYQELFSDIAILAHIAKKAMRDNGGVIQNKNKDVFYRVMRRIMSLILYECSEHRVSLFDVWQHNLDKLAGRQSRNVIKGDGDYR